MRAHSFDWWIEAYGGVDNPGPGFVREEIARVAPQHHGDLHFVCGNSHDTLPVFFQAVQLSEHELEQAELLRMGESAPRMYDLITVDGDHTAVGTWRDLVDVLPKIAVGGVLVIDDFIDTADEMLGDSASVAVHQTFRVAVASA